ncbi:MAG: hydrogenase 4 subunit F, partial [Gammaproteobacteria bacterium]|nr:hydrogenase 4 subunit F [Gammaproteobacteria bacterium]
MIALSLILLIPLFSGLLQALYGQHKAAGHLNVLTSIAQLCASLWLAWLVLQHGPQGRTDGQFYIDSFNVYLIALTALVGATTSFFSLAYMSQEQEHRHLGSNRLRLYHASYQFFL